MKIKTHGEWERLLRREKNYIPKYCLGRMLHRGIDVRAGFSWGERKEGAGLNKADQTGSCVKKGGFPFWCLRWTQSRGWGVGDAIRRGRDAERRYQEGPERSLETRESTASFPRWFQHILPRGQAKGLRSNAHFSASPLSLHRRSFRRGPPPHLASSKAQSYRT